MSNDTPDYLTIRMPDGRRLGEWSHRELSPFRGFLDHHARSLERKELIDSFNEKLLDIDELLRSGDNFRRHQRAMTLFFIAKASRSEGQRELADKIKAVGNQLMEANAPDPRLRIAAAAAVMKARAEASITTRKRRR